MHSIGNVPECNIRRSYTKLLSSISLPHPLLHNMYWSVIITLSTVVLALAQSNPPTSSSNAIAGSAITYLDNSHHLPPEYRPEHVEHREVFWYETHTPEDAYWNPSAPYDEETAEVVSCPEVVWYRVEHFAAFQGFEEETGPEPLAIEAR
jgi:hypothetical protein